MNLSFKLFSTYYFYSIFYPYILNVIAGSDQSLVDISEEDQKRLLAEYEEEMKNGSAQHSRRSSGTQLSSSSSGSFAMVTVRSAPNHSFIQYIFTILS